MKEKLLGILGVLVLVCIAGGLITAIVLPLALVSCTDDYTQQEQRYESQTVKRTVTARVLSIQLAPYDTATYELSNGDTARGSTDFQIQVGNEYRFTLSKSKKSDDNIWFISKVSLP